MPSSEAPTIDYQDLDADYGPRATLTPGFNFYTFLDVSYPAHRTLLRFNSGDEVAFKRVFSWLDVGLKTNALFAGSVATNMVAWDPTHQVLNSPSLSSAPYVTNLVANVGDRILPPAGEYVSSNGYWAGYILESSGNSFNPGAYLDPFTAGFTLANQGAIIPVNAIPGHNLLEVWWFRSDNADTARGFQPVFWPSVIGRYALQWPVGAREIVFANDRGSGLLDSHRAIGAIYYENDPAQPGYNPNEEHALMLARIFHRPSGSSAENWIDRLDFAARR